jgi:hypothetical protein
MIKTGEDWLLVLLDKKKKKYTRLSWCCCGDVGT